MTYASLLAELREYEPQQSFERDLQYALRMQKHLDKGRAWECDDATPREKRYKVWFDALNVFLK